MLKSFKTEINPTLEQKIKINKTIGTCRFVYNFYIAHNKKVYETEKETVVMDTVYQYADRSAAGGSGPCRR